MCRCRALQRLPDDVIGPLLLIDRMRAHLRVRIETVLSDAPHRGIVVALAVGAQDAVSDADWTLMRCDRHESSRRDIGLAYRFRGGTCVDGVRVYVATPQMAWRSRAVDRRGAQGIGAERGFFCGALCRARRFQRAPAQRAFWMLSVVAIAYACGRRPASSLVLCWALALVLTVSFCAVTAILFAIEARGRNASRAPEEADDAFETLDWKDRYRHGTSRNTLSVAACRSNAGDASARMRGGHAHVECVRREASPTRSIRHTRAIRRDARAGAAHARSTGSRRSRCSVRSPTRSRFRG